MMHISGMWAFLLTIYWPYRPYENDIHNPNSAMNYQ